MNNKELQMTTTMPLMKKSLLALAVAGSMAMSGGVYAADISSNTTVTGTTGEVEGAITGIVINAASAVTLTSGTGTTAVDSLVVNSISGTGAIGFTTIATAASDALTVTTGGDWGSSSTSTGLITLTGNAHTTASGITTLTVENGHTIFGAVTVVGVESDTASSDTTLIVQDGGAITGNIILDGEATDVLEARLTLGSTGSTGATITGNVTGDADGEGTITVAGIGTITGNIGVGVAAGTTALGTVTVQDGKALTVTGTVNADTVNLSHSTATGTNAITFKNTTTIADLKLGDDNASSTNNVTFDTSSQAFTATIDLSTGDSDAGDTNALIIDSGSIAAAGSVNLLTYANAIASGDKVDNITIGSTTTAGNAKFNAAVVISGTSAIVGGNTADEDSTVEFQAAVTADVITLDTTTTSGAVGQATVNFNATNDAVTVAGVIGAVDAGDGVVNVYDDDAGEAHAITFSGEIGADAGGATSVAVAQLGELNIGNATQGGAAIFTSANPVVVAAITVTGGDHADEDSIVEFQDAVTATSITLNDGLGTATIKFNALNAAQTIAGTIDGAASGEGTLNVSDGDSGEEDLITFSGIVGGTQRLSAINIGTGALSGAADFDADTTVATLTILGGDADTEDALLTNATLKTLNATTMVVTADDGDATATLGGMLVIGSGGLDINGGSADAAAKVTVAEASSTLSSGAVTIDGGVALATGGTSGGTAELETTLAVSSTGAFTVTGGNGATTSGAGVGGEATLDADAAFTTTKLVTFVGGAAGAGSDTGATGGAATGTFATTIDVLGMALTGGLGGSGEANVGGAATATVAGASTIGASGISVTAGQGGTDDGAAVGGAASLTLTGASTITGDITVTGGKGDSNDAADGGVASLTLTGAATATAQTLTIQGGVGDTDSAGDGGAANVTIAATSTFNSIVIDDGASTASNGTGGAATLTLTSTLDSTITGAITTGTDGEGAISVASGVDDKVATFASNIGTSAVRLKTLAVTSSSNVSSAGNFNGDVYVNAITVTGENTTDTAGEADAFFAKDAGFTTLTLDTDSNSAATVTFDGTTAQTITGSIKGAATGEGALAVTNTGGTVTFASALGATKLASVTLDASTTTVFDSTLASSTLSASGAMTLKGAVTLSSTLTTGNGSTITLGSAFKNGGAVAITAATSVGTLNQTAGAVTVNLSNQFTSGSVTLLDNNATLDATDLAAFTVTDTALVDYTIALGQTDASNDSLVVSASKRTTAGIATNLGMSSSQTAALGQVTAALATGDATASTAIDSALVAGGATAVNAVEQLNPDAGAATGAALASVNGANTVIAGRQANTRVAFNTLGNQSGVSTGDDANDATVWAQIFGSTATQDKVGTVDGYDADSNGLALGWETEKSGDLMGLSVSYSDADVDGKSASASHTDTTAVQVAAYGTYGKATDWMVGYASADNDTKRTISFGGLARTASGKYDSNIFTAKVGHAFDSSNTGTWTMTPKVDAMYTNIDNDGYTETGATDLNLIVASSSNDILTARAGAEFSQRIVDGNAVTIPHINVMAGYDLKNDGAETSSTFTGGGAAFTTKGADTDKASLQLGFGVDHVSDDSTVSLNFNADLRSDYDSMSGDITFKSKF